MANTILTPSIIAAEAVRILENNCVMGGLVYRGYEEEYSKRVNGYLPGDTISIRRPTDFFVRTGSTVSLQDSVEGQFQIVVNKQAGVDFQFSGTELTLKIEELSDRVIKPAMIQVANQIDRDVTALYSSVWNTVGDPTAGATSFTQFGRAPLRLDQGAVPQDDRYAVLDPATAWGMLGGQASLYIQDAARDAYRRGSLGMIANVDTYSSQNIQTQVNGTATATGGTNNLVVFGATQSTSWASSKNTGSMTLLTKGWLASGNVTLGTADRKSVV